MDGNDVGGCSWWVGATAANPARMRRDVGKWPLFTFFSSILIPDEQIGPSLACQGLVASGRAELGMKRARSAYSGVSGGGEGG